MKFARALLGLATAALIVTACASPAATSRATPPPPSLARSPSAAPTAAPTVAAQRVEVSLTDQMRIEPESMTVPAGVPVTFVVTNVGSIDHEFYLGDEDMQMHHEEEMAEMGGMMGHDEENGISVEPGQTKELTWTFDMGDLWLAGCHVPGHYPAGMRAVITVTE